MTERSIVEAAARLRRHGEPYLVATVVSVHGSAYRRPGARMLLTRFRWVAGSVTGGLLDGELSNQGWANTKDGTPVLVTYDAAHPELAEDEDIRSAFGLGCDGTVEVLLERAGLAGRIDALEFSSRCVRDQKRGAVVTMFRTPAPGIRIGSRMALAAGGELELEADPLEASVRETIAADMRIVLESGVSMHRTYATAAGPIEALIEAVLPPARLFVFGTGHDAVPVAQMGRQLGWEVVVCAKEPRFSTRERFSMADEILVGTHAEIAARIDESDRAMAVIMSHDFERDRDNLGMALATRARYVGVLGARSRTQRMLTELGAHEDERIHCPIGLELGAETPQEIALSIVAEVQANLVRSPAQTPREQITTPERPTPSRPSVVMAAVAVL